MVKIQVCREFNTNDNALFIRNFSPGQKRRIIDMIKALIREQLDCKDVEIPEIIHFRFFEEIETNDTVLFIYNLDIDQRERIIELVEALNREQLERKEVEIPDESTTLIGVQNIVPCGALYAGSTIKDVYEAYGIEGLWDLMKAAPRVDGSEDIELHDAPITKAIEVGYEAWSYFFIVVEEKMKPEDWAIILNDLPDEDKNDGSQAIQNIFSMINLEYYYIREAYEKIIKLPAYAGKTCAQIYEAGGEKAISQMMGEAVKALDEETFDIGRAFLKGLHTFKGYLNAEEISSLYRIKGTPEEIVATCAKRMDAKYDWIIKEKEKK